MTENINQENINQENNIVITNDPIHLITNQEIDNEENNQSIEQKHSDLLVLIKQKNLNPKKRYILFKNTSRTTYPKTIKLNHFKPFFNSFTLFFYIFKTLFNSFTSFFAFLSPVLIVFD